MASITGFGGVFLRTEDPKALYQWYEKHLGLVNCGGSYAFPPPTRHPHVVFALFKPDNAYFPPAQKAMINLQVDDLDGILDRLISEGIAVDPKRESYDFGKFGWLTDPRRQSRGALAALRFRIEIDGAIRKCAPFTAFFAMSGHQDAPKRSCRRSSSSGLHLSSARYLSTSSRQEDALRIILTELASCPKE